MNSDSQTLNDYGHLISTHLRHPATETESQKEHLSSVFVELRGIFARVAKDLVGTGIPGPQPEKLIDLGTDTIIRSIDDMRLRMVSVLLGAGELSVAGGNSLDIKLSKNMVTEPGGTGWAILDRTAVLLLPAIDENTDPNLIAGDLLNVYEGMAQIDRWVLDCSAVKRFPLLLLATILGYRDSLAGMKKGLRVVWLAQTVVPAEIFPSVVKLLSLKATGDFYFSNAAKND